MYYSIRHITRFRYSAPISESIMEVRIQPRTEGTQHCLDFRLMTSPRARILDYRGEQGNKVHHFDVPNRHTQLTISAHSLVELVPPLEPPETLPMSAWEELDALTAHDEYWDTLMPSHFASPTELLYALAQELHVQRRDDPLTVLRYINTGLHNSIDYSPKNTNVDSPIDDALRVRQGVCQDFAHIMITMVRTLGIPCRYVSGYLFQQSGYRDRSSESATHAWVEAMLPGLGWIGFDPTNDTLAGGRHIRVAVGRDYADVPPTRGVFRGNAESELAVTVKVSLSDALPTGYEVVAVQKEEEWVPVAATGYEQQEPLPQQQQPQQQQQNDNKH
ncbi:MAG: transglutaminase family protein [Ktedonobacteraceae bacterium]